MADDRSKKDGIADPCRKYQKLGDKKLMELLLGGHILGWGTIDGTRTVLCREAFDGRRSLGVDGSSPPPTGEGLRFFADEVRPGTGIVAVQDGREVGPGGALGLFLVEERDPGEVWFLASAHVLTDFSKRPYPDAFRDKEGLTAGSRRRKLGTVRHAGGVRPFLPGGTLQSSHWNVIDAGLVKLDSVAWKQKTTCYGEIGPPEEAKAGYLVQKCGPEEPYSTWGKVVGTDWRIRIFHNGHTYLFKDQILVQTPRDPKTQEWQQQPPFALPGDSGSLVVHATDRRPVGMLMAGSVRKNLYFLNPIEALQKYWETRTPPLVQARVATTIEHPEASEDTKVAAVEVLTPSTGQYLPGRNGRYRATDPVVASGQLSSTSDRTLEQSIAAAKTVGRQSRTGRRSKAKQTKPPASSVPKG